MSDKPLRIFLVDDNEIDLIVNEKLLRISGLTDTVERFASATDFLQRFDGLVDASSYRNVLLLDIMMPGLNGFECAQAISERPVERRAGFQVFVLSSSIDRNDIARASAIPLVGRVLEKPLDTYLLKGLINP